MRNEYKIAKGQWKKWSPNAQRVFNRVYEMMVNNQDLFLHPKALQNTNAHWKTTAHNAAWEAADAADGR